MSSHPGRRGPTALSAATLGAVAAGGSVGALLRWLLELGLPAGSGWPWATVVANVLGSAALGWLLARDEMSPLRGWVRAGAGTGLLGGFTTFSTYAVQVAVLGRDEPALALGYLVATPLLCVCAAALAGTATMRMRGHR
ncbi:fluoride efflux transporter FluC [Ornithinimicrobium flavum]|uniref:fluoride efflux transporter FluC n=1 Tax=Ornithinimicrobium flavum TaxID=1288636 RepID=UPI00193110A3|nr:CrcB family protein [Ornithinimicrobium flavum]